MHYRNGREAKNGDEIVQIKEVGAEIKAAKKLEAATAKKSKPVAAVAE